MPSKSLLSALLAIFLIAFARSADVTTAATNGTTPPATNPPATTPPPVVTAPKPTHFCLDGADNSFVSFGVRVGDFATRNFTVALWVQTNETLALFDLVGNRRTLTNGNFFQMRMAGAGANKGQVIVELNENAAGLNYANLTSKTMGLNDNKWHHLTFVRSGPTMSLYVDGKLDNTGASKGIANITTPVEFKIGRSAAAAAGARFAPVACYGDLRVTWRDLAASEVATLFNTSTH